MTDSKASELYEQPSGVVIDNGSYSMKVGFTGETAPRQIFPSFVGRPRHQGVMVGMGRKDAYVGDEAISKRGILSLIQPLEYGMVTNWDDMEKIWHHSFYNELRVAPEEQPVLVTDKIPNAPNINREKIIQIMFETFNVPAFYVANQSALALYSTGKTSGIVLDCGYQTTYCIPIVQGKILSSGVTFSDVGGKNVTGYLGENILNRHYPYLSEKMGKPQVEATVEDIKHSRGYVSYFNHLNHDLYAERLFLGFMRSQTQFDVRSKVIPKDIISMCDAYYDASEYTLPYADEEESKIYLNRKERTQAFECLFDPKLLTGVDDKHSGEPGIHELCRQTMRKLSDAEKAAVGTNVVVFGGSSMAQGIEHRLEKELKKVCKTDGITVTLGAEKDAKQPYCAWLGGSIMGSLSSFEEMWVTQEQYDEVGPTIVHKNISADQFT